MGCDSRSHLDGSITASSYRRQVHGTRNVGEITSIVDNKDVRLLPNINVGVTIITNEDQNVLSVPREAVRQEDGKTYVYQVANDTLERRDVQTSVSNLTQVEVTSGISEDALVAIASTNTKPLRPGLTVKVVH